MQKYQSKKDESVIAQEIEKDEKCKTTILEYLTGEKTGKTISVSDSTLKRWWRKVKEDEAVEEIAKIEPEDEILRVELEDEETGKVRKLAINPNEIGVDPSQYNFNPTEAEKSHIPVPDSVKEFAKDFCIEHFLAGGEPYPDIETVVDLCVECGATVKRYGGFITLTDKTKILFRRNCRIVSKSVFEVRMTKEISEKVSCLEVTEEPLKGAMCKGVDFVVRVKTMNDLKTLIKEISKN